jgi:hypothetical protein
VMRGVGRLARDRERRTASLYAFFCSFYVDNDLVVYVVIHRGRALKEVISM